ncbi:MAG: S8 family serine peptidase [Candidatus Geothermincolia bacterium]
MPANAAAAPAAPSVGRQPYRGTQPGLGVTYQPGEIIVKLRQDTPSSKVRQLEDRAGVRRQLEVVEGLAGGDLYELELDQGVDVLDAVRSLERDPEVLYAEPNYLGSEDYAPSDPDFPDQWGLDNTGQGGGTPDCDIRATEAWDLEKGQTNPVTAALIDSGVDLNHPELQPNIWNNTDEIPENGIDDDANGYVDDVQGYNYTGISQRNYSYWSGGHEYYMYRMLGFSTGDPTWHPAGVGNPDDPELYGVSAYDESHIWAVGASGSINFCDGSQWSIQSSGTTYTLRDVSAEDSTHVWAVGDHGTILFFNGTTWTQQASGTTENLQGVCVDAEDVGWAVGDHGTVLKFDGSSWVRQSLGITANLSDVSAIYKYLVWIAGEGFVYQCDNGTWSTLASDTEYSYTCAAAMAPGMVWAAGTHVATGDEVIRYFNGTTWANQSIDTGSPVNDITVLDEEHAWAVGENGCMYVFNGSNWTIEPISGTPQPANDMRGVTCLDQNLAWAAGSSGLATRYYAGGSQRISQSITGTGGTLSGGSFIAAKVGNPTGVIDISLREALTGRTLDWYGTISASSISATPTSMSFTFSEAPRLEAGVTYYLVVHTTNHSASDYFVLYENDANLAYGTYDLYREGQEYVWDGALWDGYDDDDLAFTTNENPVPHDDDGHGTHVAGTLGAEANNLQGITGVSMGVTLMPLKVTPCNGGGIQSADVVRAIKYAADNGAKLINMSIGFAGLSAPPEGMQDAINYAWSKGTTVIASVGNRNSTPIEYPAGCEHVIGVGATDRNDQRAVLPAWGSNYNSSVDVTAPGAYIFSTLPTYQVALTSPPPGPGLSLNYDWMGGTSMATPHVSGTAALMLSANPALRPDDIEFAIESTARDLGGQGRDDEYGFGRIDAYSALAGPHVDTVSPPTGLRGSTKSIRIDVPGAHFQQWWPDVSFSSSGIEIEMTSVIPGAQDYMFATIKIAENAPLGARTVSVTNRGEYIAPLPNGFTVLDNKPEIDGISPVSGVSGDTVTIWGSNFGSSRGTSNVRFGSTQATQYVSWSDAQVKVKVPEGASSCIVKVTTASGTSNGYNFIVESPVITNLVPVRSKPGDTVTIQGSNFGTHSGSSSGASGGAAGSSYLSFNGVVATQITSWSDTSIVAVVPEGSTSGAVTVVTGGGTSNTNKAMTLYYPAWYLAEGTTAWGFDTYISIENPNATAVTANVTYMTSSGAVNGGTVTLPAYSQTTVNPRDRLGDADFSTKVDCTTADKSIAVDRTMTWTGEGSDSPEAHASVGVTSPAETWYLPEGSSAWGFETWLLVQNPNGQAVTAAVTYMIEGADAITVNKTIPANSRASFSMADDIGEHDASIKVVADAPVIPERAMYKDDRAEGHDSIGTTRAATAYYLAEGTTAWGFTTYVLVQNPNTEAATVTLTYMTADGPEAQEPFTMEPNSRKTVRVNDALDEKDFSTMVESNRAIIAERAMYWDTDASESCHDSIGLAGAHTSFYLPDGQTSEGRETYTLVQNPNEADVVVEVTYLTSSGAGNVSFQDTVKANSRKTYSMADRGINGRAAVMVTCKTAGKKVICERAMYWNERRAGTDTIGGYAD